MLIPPGGGVCFVTSGWLLAFYSPLKKFFMGVIEIYHPKWPR